MKWKKKLRTCRLLAGLTVLICSSCNKEPSLRLIASKTINFPSASGIEFFNDTLYIFGDNATRILQLSTDYQEADSYTYLESEATIIDKENKPDIESAMIINRGKGPLIVGVGSMSGEKRWSNIELSIAGKTITRTEFFRRGTTFDGIAEINIEGSTAFNDGILLCNRANLTTRKNHLLFLQKSWATVTKEIELPLTEGLPGMSGLHYVKEKDLLLFTASEEATSNAFEDGTIGESYVGWISNFSKASENKLLQPSGFLKLSDYDSAFTGQKIESICLESLNDDGYLLHLSADNDNSKSVLFKVVLKL